MYDIAGFYEAKSASDAVRALTEDPNAILISGGTDVLIRVREGRDAGRSLVSIKGLKELTGVRLDDDGTLVIGPCTTFTSLTGDPLIQRFAACLGEAADTVGGPQIRNMGTIGGNIMNGATSADTGAAMLSFDASAVLLGPDGERTVPLSEFYTGPGKTVRERNEVCTSFRIPRSSYEGFSGAYFKYGKRRSMEIATLGCMCRVKLSADGRTVDDVRLAFGVAAPTPIRCRAAEAAVKGRAADEETAVLLADTALTEVNPRTSWRASKEFRMQLVHELSKRAFFEAARRGGGAAGA